MTLSPFQRGGVVGALSTVALVAAAFVATVFVTSSDTADPTAARHEVRGVVVSRTDEQVCVAPAPGTGSDDPSERGTCGVALGGAVPDTIEIGDDVVGDIVEVELDPDSGPAWVLWSYLAPDTD